ncbi:iron chelate uptake ABC transporter family permease subunit [Terribacillus saccharophilus]|jgi:iron complex transport system permease protein|uniref:Iron ABC transporter permease n=1 Tax=Terribacillus saccharophilus TaxID=361277 RepID=A0A268AFH9_9BACI|nr:iron chelate uptake ABC transporter family permease subunit [Terribacillus saccharophilus]PAD22877.1 iron ABC transporter permease [Terribacillus saccharophilus]PAD36062.1 iron ABC transporter permease [Terribacillus saccharophilus]PAD96888.1 iron ABC transporter permease [Terribacillus saccharophilus]PAE00464.1 iron ABC transporter permease [Terribacillus saccharophilus]
MLKRKIILLLVVALSLASLYLFIHMNFQAMEYLLRTRLEKILAMILCAVSIGVSTVVFQTITHNRILTPSIMGLDSVYMFIQTIVVFLFGSGTFVIMQSDAYFFLTILLMVGFAFGLYQLLFRRGQSNLFLLLLVGLVLGTFFSSLSSFMQMIIDPNEFLLIQDSMFASFTDVNTDLLLISAVIITVLCIYIFRYRHYFDVMSIGRDHAVNLGVPYEKIVKRMFLVIAVLVAVSTALVGPITFLGLLTANLAREFLQTFRHTYLLIAASLLSVIALLGGQLVVERIFSFSTPISVIINFVGGIYFIYLLVRESKKI